MATVTVTPAINTVVQVTVDGVTYNVPVVNGTGTLTLPQQVAGTYTVSATLAEDDKYEESTTGDNTAQIVAVPGITFPFAANQTWATWCDDWAWGKPAGVTAYTISAVNGNTVTISEVSGDGVIPSHTPLLLKKISNVVTPTKVITGTVPDEGYNATTGLTTKAATGATFWGNASDTKITTGYNYAIGQSYGLYNGEFVLIDTDNGIAANRCMLNVTTSGNQAPTRLTISKDGDATGITTTDYTDLTDSDGSWYSLDGRKLNGKPTKKGVYIYKGVKRVVK